MHHEISMKTRPVSLQSVLWVKITSEHRIDANPWRWNIYKNLLRLNLSIELSHPLARNQSSITMYNLQHSMVPMNQQPLLLLPYVNPFLMQQLLASQFYIMPWCEGFHSLPYYAAPVYQETGHWQQNQYQYRPPSSGPSRNQHGNGFREAESQTQYHYTHESSGTPIANDRSTGIHRGHAPINASNDTRVGKVCRTPSKNQLLLTTT